jgi:hypothetical protein
MHLFDNYCSPIHILKLHHPLLHLTLPYPPLTCDTLLYRTSPYPALHYDTSELVIGHGSVPCPLTAV